MPPGIPPFPGGALIQLVSQGLIDCGESSQTCPGLAGGSRQLTGTNRAAALDTLSSATDDQRQALVSRRLPLDRPLIGRREGRRASRVERESRR
ncbi:hypothetical protein FMEAI12_2550009 [Parafrankia sp. Ea1.12]|nr:hypothetical protein FMEAI12_2550009 [Parafrankia sp. Ea1.12]